MTTINLGLDEAKSLVTDVLAANRVSEQNAALVAAALCEAEAEGNKGHGLSRIPSYAAQALNGKVDGFANPISTRTATGSLMIDAGLGFAFPALQLAIDEIPDIAAQTGLCAAGITRSHHAGVQPDWLLRPWLKRVLLDCFFANTPAAIAPWGGKTALFGTNPVAFAFPLLHDEPVVIDLSLSKVARGKIMAAKGRGETIPPDWAFDALGESTTDPQAALAGTMAPHG